MWNEGLVQRMAKRGRERASERCQRRENVGLVGKPAASALQSRNGERETSSYSEGR